MATTRKSIVRFEERAELLDFLLEVTDATSETLDLDRILANVGTHVKEVIPYDLFAILLYSERQKGLSIRYAIGHREEVVRSMIVKLEEGLTGAAATTRLAIRRSSAASCSLYALARVDCRSMTPTSFPRAIMGTASSVRTASTVAR